MINILLVEREPMARQLLELLLNKSEKYRLVGTVEDAAEMEGFCRTQKVDMILLDVVSAGCIAAAGNINQRKPKIKIILMVGQPECSFLLRAQEAGVDSFWYKRYPALELFGIMERTASGERIFPAETPAVKLGNIWSSELSKSELEVLRYVVEGDTDAIIAEKLFITVPTVKSHMQNIKNRTGFRNRTEIAVKARESGLIIP